MTGFVTRSILAAPLLVKNKLIGVAEVINRKDGNPFDDEDVSLFSTFCSSVAMAIENARLYDEAVTKTKELSEINSQLELAQTNLISALNETELANKRLQDTQAQLIHEQKMATLGLLASSVGHEVNNPLMIIAGRAQLALASDIKDEEAKKSMKIIYDQCYRAKAIIQRLLTFSKPSASDMQDYDIGSVIDEVVNLIEHQYGLDNIKIIKYYRTIYY